MIRVFQLAKELDMTSKDLISDLAEIGIVVPNHMTALTDEQLALARREFSGDTPADTPAAAAAEPAAEPAAPAAAEAAPAPAAEPPAPPPPAEPPATPPKPKSVQVKPQMVLKELAALLGLKPNILIAELMKMNVFASINERIDHKMAHKLGERLGILIELEKPPEKKPPPPVPTPSPKDSKETKLPPAEIMVARPPVVTFMGHVDHGKTSLLDCIRKTKVAAGEAGGITQHIGAYMVEARDRKITFIDTPGHAAFTTMRARGANLTDIAVIVISADEGVKPQTLEAIQHARAADVSIMVAINKIDLPNANVDRVLAQLQQQDLTPEEWGGKTICCRVSATTGQGIDEMLEMILLQADVMELKADVRAKARGYVLEARMEPGMGPTATLLVTEGTLHVGDPIVCGDFWGRVKALISDRGVKIRTATPSFAIQCLGLTSVPEAGAEFHVVANDREARAFSEERMSARRVESLQTPKRAISLDDLLTHTDAAAACLLPVVLKTDVQGTLEAIAQAIQGIKSDKVQLKVILSGVGNVTGNDVLLAKASNAIVIGFHVSTEDGVTKVAKREGVEIRLYSIIYELIDEVKAAMAGLLDPILKESPLGQAVVKQVFVLSRKGAVAGCLATGGRISSRARARVRRQGDVVYEGSVSSLRRFQNDASEVREGQECGIRLADFADYKEGDVIEFYEVQKIAQEL